MVADLDERTGSWRPKISLASTHPPAQSTWGDYFAIQPDPRRTTYWMASGYTLQGGNDLRNIEPLVVTFRR